MVQRIDQQCDVFRHIYLAVPLSLEQFRCAVNQIGGKYFLKVAFFVCLIKRIQSVGEETEGCADEQAAGATGFELLTDIQYRLTRGDHIVYQNEVFTLYTVA